MRTAPAPNVPPIPGMNPGVFVAGGGAGGGDAQPEGTPDQELAGHPVDVVTGRVFTDRLVDWALPGPLPLWLCRSYSAHDAERDVGLGHGWSYDICWEIDARRGHLMLFRGGVSTRLLPVRGAPGTWASQGGIVAHGPSDQWPLTSLDLDAGDGLLRTFERAASDNALRLVVMKDRFGNTVRCAYHRGKLARITDSAGRNVRFNLGPDGHVTQVIVPHPEDPHGEMVAYEYGYDAEGNLVRARDAEGFEATYAYDDQHRLTRDTDRTGFPFFFRYDAEGRCVETWGEPPQGTFGVGDLPPTLRDGETKTLGVFHTKIMYGEGGYREVVTANGVRRVFGNARGTADKSIDGAGVTTRAYDARGRLVGRTYGDGATVRWELDDEDRPVSLVDALGNVTRYEWGEGRSSLAITDAAGQTHTMVSDAAARAIVRSHASGATLVNRYDERGMLISSADREGLATYYQYDAQANLIRVERADRTTTLTYDRLGRCTSARDSRGRSIEVKLSLRGDIRSITHEDGKVTTFAHDGERHPIQSSAPGGRTWRFDWFLEHLARRVDPLGYSVVLRYDADGALASVENERGERHTFDYDAHHRVSSERTADGRAVGFSYDKRGRVDTIRDADGAIVEIERDLAGQVRAHALPSGDRVEFEYDVLGRVVKANNEVGEWRFGYDQRDNVVREEQVLRGGPRFVIERRYDVNDRVIAVTTNQGAHLQIERDAWGRRLRTDLGGAVIDHARDASGNRVSAVLSGRAAIEREHDVLGRQTRCRVVAGSATTYERRVSYDERGEVASIEDPSGRSLFEHDACGRLVRHAREGFERVFQYDGLGDVHEGGLGDVRVSGARALERRYGPGGRLVGIGSRELSYDACGRVTLDRDLGDDRASRTFHWKDGALAAVSTADIEVRFRYDPFGRRVSKEIIPRAGARSTIFYVWDNNALIQEVRYNGRESREIARYAFADDAFTLLAQGAPDPERPNVLRWFFAVTDQAGAVAALVSDAGKPACSITYDALGRGEVAPGALVATPWRLLGHYQDAETGLVYQRARYCDPTTARYLSPDPIGLAAGTHPYWLGPSTLDTVDPFGLKSRSWMSKDKDSDGYAEDDKRFQLSNIPFLYTLDAHGSGSNGLGAYANGRGIYDSRGDQLQEITDVDELIKKLKADGYKGGPIRLAVCGAAVGGESSIAARLSRKLGVPVIAPNATLTVYKDGTYYIGESGYLAGEWITYGGDLPFFPRSMVGLGKRSQRPIPKPRIGNNAHEWKRDPDLQSHPCSRCARPAAKGQDFCPNCREGTRPLEYECSNPKCKATFGPNMAACPKCGNKF